MPQLNLTDIEAKVAWMVLDRGDHLAHGGWLPPELREVEMSLFSKVYRAYRGMPQEKVA